MKKEEEKQGGEFGEINAIAAISGLTFYNNVLLNTILDLLKDLKAKVEEKEKDQIELEVRSLLESNRIKTGKFLKESPL